MILKVDAHSHTVASCHAYSTLRENAREAYEKGLEAFVISDHGPAVQGAAPGYILSGALAFVPDYVEGVRLVKGVEANIIDYEGGMDIKDKYFACTEFAIAALHTVCIRDGGITENTNALIGALRNPYVDVIAHSGNPQFPIDIDAYLDEVERQGKLVEINNQSFVFRTGSEENCKEIIRQCKRRGIRLTVASDSHFCKNMGEFDHAVGAIEECGFPEELIVSSTKEKFFAYLEERKRRCSGAEV
jgi:putative hydrolase